MSEDTTSQEDLLKIMHRRHRSTRPQLAEPKATAKTTTKPAAPKAD
ncbi:hypothetical protein VB780_14090 [Leptolyngbya sp. CCNP1308]|nr:hypothetical protein [Leptolyngbya sp. CCNP1308]MEA5449710.1 hypothetical protein [Leptolyngbya sp. CCNP1308]